MSVAPSVSSRGLALLDRAHRLLSEANSLDDLIEVRDTADAARTFAKAAKLGLELQNRAAELKLRAERKAGTFLAKLKLRGGDRRSKSPRVTLNLEELGVTNKQSQRWQLAASVSDPDFEKYVRGRSALGQEVTSSGLLCLAKTLRSRAGQSPTRKVEATSSVVGERQAGKAALLAMISELKEQSRHLAELLKPLAADGQHIYKPAERRFIGRLAQDVEKSINDIEKLVWVD
jgi:hypothetical protein